MVLAIDTSTPAGIFQLIFGLICLPVVFLIFRFAFAYIIGGMSKVSNRTFVKRGKVVSTPDDFDTMNDIIKEKTIDVFNKIKSVTGKVIDNTNKANIERIITDSTTEKINKLKDIEALKNNGTIDDDEFEILKKEVMKSK